MDAAELDGLAALLIAASTPLSRAEAARRLGLDPYRLASRLTDLVALGAPVHEDETGLRLVLTDALDAATITTGLADLEWPPAVAVYRVCESTNALAQWGSGPHLCLAEAQTAGRGRRGQAWVQPFATGLALSYGVRLRVDRVEGLAIAMAVATAQSLAACGFADIGLKWPNDLYVRDGKLGGVLVEIAGGAEPCLTIGIGLNVHVAPILNGRATAALADLGPVPPRNALAIGITRALAGALARFEREGFEPFKALFAQLDVLAGRPVYLANGNDTIFGIARGIGSRGEIVVETAVGVCRYTVGEVSLRQCRNCL